MHDKAIEAAIRGWYRLSETAPLIYEPNRAAARRAIAAFLRAWEPKVGIFAHNDGVLLVGESMKLAARKTADELEADNA